MKVKVVVNNAHFSEMLEDIYPIEYSVFVFPEDYYNSNVLSRITHIKANAFREEFLHYEVLYSFPYEALLKMFEKACKNSLFLFSFMVNRKPLTIDIPDDMVDCKDEEKWVKLFKNLK